MRGEGAGQGQGTRDINVSYSYPLVDPRLEEAHDNSTVVQCTGVDCSIVQPLDVMDKPLYSQHLEDDEHDDEQDANDLGAGQGDERDDDQDAIDPGARQDDERDDDQEAIKGDGRDDDQDAIEPGARQDDERDEDQDEIDQRGGDVYEGGGAGLGDAVKGEGVRRGQDTGDIDASYSYPLVDPRLEEAHGYSTVVQCTGAEHSLAQPLDMMDNHLYSQHQEDDEHDDEQDTRSWAGR